MPPVQLIRIADVLVIGPLMLWAGLKLSRMYPLAGGLLAVSGVGTVAYNGANFLRVQQSGEQIPGGRAQGRRPQDFDQGQLQLGVEVELEHTDDRALALEIAMDHLVEDPRYYDKLRAAGL